jgi:hypothetical protein
MRLNAVLLAAAAVVFLIATSVIGGRFYTSWMPHVAETHEFPSGFPGVEDEPKTFSWKFQSGPQSKTGHISRVVVTLKLDDQTYDVGTFDGSCAEIGAPGTTPLQSDERIAVQCWSSEGGDEIGVFADSGHLVVAHARLQTRSDYRTNFTPLFEL